MLAVAVATKATAVAAVVVVADMAAALAAKAPVAVAVVAADVDAAALVATVDRLGVKRCRSRQEKGLLGALFLRPQKQRQQRIGAHLAAPVAVNLWVKGGTNG